MAPVSRFVKFGLTWAEYVSLVKALVMSFRALLDVAEPDAHLHSFVRHYKLVVFQNRMYWAWQVRAGLGEGKLSMINLWCKMRRLWGMEDLLSSAS